MTKNQKPKAKSQKPKAKSQKPKEELFVKLDQLSLFFAFSLPLSCSVAPC
ncbi:MAG: hypothetical protein MJK04_16410 [Psychrosphaera sp.]|nr:hypothetical protein [Psychrosphaera sp.]